jgi:heme-degrading monooxygenase HmoA
MYIYITIGTYEFLKKMKEKYSQKKMTLMKNEDGALLLHESNEEPIFKEPRRYEILDTKGDIGECGFVVFNHIPVTDEGRPIFEYRFKNRSKQIENEPGFQSIRVLRPLSSNTYIIMTVWETAFNHWKDSASFKGAHHPQGEEQGVDPQPKIFASASYTKKYTLSD